MPKKLSLLVLNLLLTFTVSAPLLSAAQMRGQARKGRFSNSAITAADKREGRIKEEIAKLKNHEWAGEYRYGDGLGVNVKLTLAPESGFVFTWRGCLGLYDLNYGGIRFEDGLVKLIFQFPNSRGGFHGIAPALYPVKWGGRHYLIPSDGVIKFCNAVNSGLEPCTGMCAGFLLRRDDEKKEVAGQPNIPVEYKGYLLTKPITAEIASIERSQVEKDKDIPELKFRISEVTLSAGKAEGVLRGLELYSFDPSNAEIAEITEVHDHTSKARIVQVGIDGAKSKVGWRLSTRLIDRAPPPK